MLKIPGTQKVITFNSPVVLVLALLCTAVTALSYITGEVSTWRFFCVYPSSLYDPLTYVRLFGHVLGHADWEHLMGNMMYILMLGPMLEEKHGSKNILIVIIATAVFTGVMHMLFSESTLLGASGVAFAFILWASITTSRENEIPLTFILVALLYIGQQVYEGITSPDDVSQITHIIGGAVGSVMGFSMSRAKAGKKW